MDTTCPVTRAYLNTVRNLYDLTLVQNELWLEPIEEMLDRAAHGGGSRFVQHQRAFYSIELMLFRFVMKRQRWAYVKDTTDTPWLQWERSREGLNYVLDKANEIRDDLLAEVIEYYYLAERPRGIEQITHDTNRQQADLFKLICESCVILRQSLKNSEVTLTRVGKRLALASNVSTFYIGDMLLFAEELLAQNEGMGRRAWEPLQT